MRARGLACEGFFYLYLLGLGGATGWSVGVNVVDEGGLLEPRRRRLGDPDGVLVVVVGDCRSDGAGDWTTRTHDRDGGLCGGMLSFHLCEGDLGSLEFM
jgi:hypothetical protein